MTNITPSHLPKGTIIETSLYCYKDGEIQQYYGSLKHDTVQFVVDHILVVDGWTGRNFIVVTTTPNLNPVYDGDNHYKFNIDHVNKILFTGKKMDIRYKEPNFFDYIKSFDKTKCHQHEMRLFMGITLSKLQPQNKFKIDDALNNAVKAGVFIGVPETKLNFRVKGENVELAPYEKFVTFRVNQKKLKKWAKQNVNRYITSNAELKKQEEKAEAEMYKDLENGFDREYDNSWVADEKPDQELKPVMDEEPRIEDYEMLSPEEKAFHDGLYGGRTEADFA